MLNHEQSLFLWVSKDKLQTAQGTACSQVNPHAGQAVPVFDEFSPM